MRLLSDDTSASFPPRSMPSRAEAKVAYVPSALDWTEAKLSRDGFNYGGSASPKLFRDVAPPEPPTLPPVNMPSEGDDWLQITNGIGDKRSTWRVRVQPYPDDRALPIQEGAGFVRLGFDGISREDLLSFLYAHSVDVDKVEQERDGSTFDRFDALYGEKHGNFLLIPERAVELPEYEAGRGRFAAAAQLEHVFLRFVATPYLEED